MIVLVLFKRGQKATFSLRLTSNIEVIEALPLGCNLHDHTTIDGLLIGLLQ